MKKIFIFIFILKFVNIIAHPHVFLEAFTEPKISNESIEGITFTISIDEMNSLIFLEIYDLNSDGAINKNEFTKLANEKFSGIARKKSHFHIKYDDINIPIKKYILKDVFIDNSNLIYKIFIPLNIKIKSSGKLNIGIYDEDYYYDYSYPETYFLTKKIERKFKCSLIENDKISYYMGNLNPLEFEVIFWKIK